METKVSHLNLDRTKVYDAILHGHKPRTHSYGFAQIYLGPNNDCRLHLFSEKVTVASAIPEQVPVRHNHRYDFRSTVLKGIVIDEPCSFVPNDRIILGGRDLNPNFDLPWSMHEVRPAHHGINERPARVKGHGDLWKDGTVVPADIDGFVVERTPRVIRAGQTYEMKSHEFHQTHFVGETVSLFKRTNVSEAWSKLLVPSGYTAEHSMSKQPEPEWLKDQFCRAIAELSDADMAFITKEAGL